MRPYSVVVAVRSAFCLIDPSARCAIGLCIGGIAIFEGGMLLASWLLLKLVLGATVANEPLEHPGHLGLVLSAILTVMILRTLTVTWLWTLITRHLAQMQQRRAGELFTAYLNLSYLELLSASRSQMLENMRQVSRTFMQESLLPVLFFVSDALVAAAVFAVLMVLAPETTVLVAGWLAIIFTLIQRCVIHPNNNLAPLRWAAFRRIAEFDEWSLQQIQTIRVQMEESVVRSRHHDLVGDAALLSARISVAGMLPRYVVELAFLSSTVLLFGWFALQGDTSATVLSELAIFTLAGMRLLPAVQRGLAMINTMQQGVPVREGIAADIAKYAARTKATCTSLTVPRLFVHEIMLQEIAFAYPNGPSVIPPGTTLALKRGEWLHIKGASGEGKSTLLALILGLLRPDKGRILLDGKPANPSKHLRGPRVAIVAQDSRLLHGSIAENLAFPISKEQLNEPIAEVLMREIGLDFPLVTNIGEGGAQLSGGQRQRLAIVKAMLKHPELLLLDEATAQLDSDNERIVFDMVRHQLPDATVIVVAHKLDSGLRFDRVWEKVGSCWREAVFAKEF